MAVFGLTELHEDDALRAVRVAVEMRETLVRLNEDRGAALRRRAGDAHRDQHRHGCRAWIEPGRNFVAA